MEKIAVLGGGAGGLSCSADLSMVGHSVNLFELPQFKAKHIDAIQKRGGIEVKGLIEGLANLNLVTTNVKEAVKGVNIVLIVTPGYGTETLCKVLIPHLEEEQTVIFHGKGGHTLELVRILKELGVKKKVTLGETHTLPYYTRLTGPGQVTIAGRLRILLSSAFPAKDNAKIVTTLKKLYPSNPPYKYKVIPGENVLAVTLCDLNAMGHPMYVIFNLSRVNSEKKDFHIYLEGAAPSITKVRDAIEKERLAVMQGFGLKPVPAGAMRYPTDQLTQAEKEWIARFNEYVIVSSTKERFITEDVPYGLVTIASLADMVGVQTPLIDAVINISSIINETDYWKEGRTTEKLGISRLNLYELRKFLDEGEI